MSFLTELKSMIPSHLETAATPTIGSRAPSTDKLVMPDADGKPVIVAFLRHCGYPFAEKTYRKLHDVAQAHPNIKFIAVSHSSPAHTASWVSSVALEPSEVANVRVIVDESRSLYAAWGLGNSSFPHWMSPSALLSVMKLGREEGIWNRPTESGNRWQTSGSWAVDKEGIIRWGGPGDTAGDEKLWNFDEATQVVSDVRLDHV